MGTLISVSIFLSKHLYTHPCFGIATHKRQTQITEGIKESQSNKPVGRLWKWIIWIVTAVQHVISPRNTCVSHYNTRTFQSHQYYFIFILVFFFITLNFFKIWIILDTTFAYVYIIIVLVVLATNVISLTDHPQFQLSCLFLCRDYTRMNIFNEKLNINGCV